MNQEPIQGFCPICGKSGINGEECLDCHEMMVAIESNPDEFENPEKPATYSEEQIKGELTEKDLLEE